MTALPTRPLYTKVIMKRIIIYHSTDQGAGSSALRKGIVVALRSELTTRPFTFSNTVRQGAHAIPVACIAARGEDLAVRIADHDRWNTTTTVRDGVDEIV